MDARVQIIAIACSLCLLITILEAVRRRRLREQFALIWLLTGAVLLLLSLWRDLLHEMSAFMGIFYPPSALLLVFIGLIVLVLLSFSVIVSDLSAKMTRLTQQLALLEFEQTKRNDDALLTHQTMKQVDGIGRKSIEADRSLDDGREHSDLVHLSIKG